MDFFQIMGQFFADSWHMMTSRAGGPFHLRLIIQPIVAAAFGVRAGLADAKAGRPPYFWSIFGADVHDRRALLQDGWSDVRKVFLMAVGIDLVYQIVVLRWVYPVQALLIAIVLALLPYLVFRGATNRLR